MTLGKISNWPTVIAHRGASAYAPENTLAAFVQAYQRGASWVEFDVKLSADGVLIVLHDDDLARTTNGSGLAVEHCFEDLCALDAGSWFSKAFAGEHIPSLEDVLYCLGQYGMGANIEIKPNPGQAEQTANALLDCLAQHWPENSPPPLVSSFEIQSLQIARERDQMLALGMLFNPWESTCCQQAEQLNCVSIHLKQKEVTAKRVKHIQSAGFKVMAYTVNDAPLAKRLWNMGVDTIFSDCPDRMLALL